MNTMHVKLIFLMLLSILILTNCEDIVDDSVVSAEDSTAAAVLVNDANAIMLPVLTELLMTDPDSADVILAGMDLGDPSDFYAEALELDWRNQNARLGVGLSGVIILSQGLLDNGFLGSVAKVYSPFADSEEQTNPFGYGFGLPLSSARMNAMIAAYYELPLSFAGLKFEQLDDLNTYLTQVEDEFLPLLDASLTALDSLDNDPDYTFTLGADLQLDIVDITSMEASLLGLQGIFKAMIAYNYPLDTSDPATIISGLSSGSVFGTLTQDGPELLADAFASALASVEKALLALDHTTSWPASEPNPFFQFNEGSAAQVQGSLEALTTALNATTEVAYGFADERGEFSVDGMLNMNISQYYQNPVLDLKSLLPDYTMSTTTSYIYNQVVLTEDVNLEEAQVTISGLNNTPVSVEFRYSESNADTVALVTMGFFTYDLMVASEGSLPTAFWDLWSEFQTVIAEYAHEAYNFPEIDFQWQGFVTTGASLTIDGTFSIDYLERVSEYAAPEIQWSDSNEADWLAGWTDPTVNGLFPDFDAEDLAALLGLAWQ